jgi:hypothetical protein
LKLSPSTKLAASESRKRTALAISSLGDRRHRVRANADAAAREIARRQATALPVVDEIRALEAAQHDGRQPDERRAVR